MGDQPTDGPPADPQANLQRVFYSSTAAGEFFEQLQVVLEAQHTRTLPAQEAFVNQINAPIVAHIPKPVNPSI